MSERTERLNAALAAIDAGDADTLRELFTEDAQWIGVPGGGFEGETPI